MSRLLDGPAGEHALANARAPHFLRVTIDPKGAIDCLDQLEDAPRDDERIHVYELVPGTYHGVALVRMARPATCVPMASGDYRHRPDVDGDLVRDTDAWRAWCRAQPIAAQYDPWAGWTIPEGYTPTNISRCRGCSEDILWATTPAGKRAPLNQDGTSHFSSCPDAARFRRTKAAAS